MSDAPDWTTQVSITGGSTGYASLTGPGQTGAPGELTQNGEFIIHNSLDTGGGISITESVPVGQSAQLDIKYVSSPAGLTITAPVIVVDDTTGFTVNDTGSSGAGIALNSSTEGIALTFTGGGANPQSINMFNQSSLGGHVINIQSFGSTATTPAAVNVSAQSANLGRPYFSGSSYVGGTVGTTFNTSTLVDSLGFYGATPIAKPAVTGSRSGGTALTSLLTTLATLGLITNSTTA